MTQINWLHLTDLHVGMREQSHLLPAIKSAFKDDLARLHAKSGPWDLVLFTGDLTQRASVEEFSQLDRFLAELWDLFKRLGSNPSLVAVPGNHDLVRPDPEQQEVMLLNAWGTSAKVRELFWRAVPAYRNVIDVAFANYMAWWERNPYKLPATKGLLPGDFSSILTKGEVSIGIVGLNSSYLQLTDENAMGKLVLSARQFQAVCEGDGPSWVRNRTANLLITHHPPDWLSDDARAELRSDIAAGNFFALHLFGHMHEARFQATSTGGTATVRVSQGTSLFGLEHFGDGDRQVARRHGYAAGRIECIGDQGHLTLWPREVHTPGGIWNFAPSVIDFKLENEATVPDIFPLNKTEKSDPRLALAPSSKAGLPAGPRRWAVVVGVNNYKFGPLQFCANDATKVASALREKLRFDGVYEVHDDVDLQPSRDTIFDQLIRVRDSGEVKPDDLFVFYFSGHGVQERGKDYLLPSNSSLADAAELGVSLESLCTQLSKLGCRNTAIVVDACREPNRGAKGAVGALGASSRELLEQAGIVAFFSCGSQDLSYEIEDLKHGSFTFCLLQAIDEGTVTTVAQLDEYLRLNVPIVNARHKKPPQRPYAVFAPAAQGLVLLGNPMSIGQSSDSYERLEDKMIHAMGIYDDIDLKGPYEFLLKLKTGGTLSGNDNQKLSVLEVCFSGEPSRIKIASLLKYWARTAGPSRPGLPPIKTSSGLR